LLPRAAHGRANLGRLRDIQLPGAEPGPVRLARHALATLALLASPAAIVVDSDPENGELLVHSFRGGWPHLDRVVAPVIDRIQRLLVGEPHTHGLQLPPSRRADGPQPPLRATTGRTRT
jgi:hypothetical protein